MKWLYDKGRQGFLEGSIDWDTDVIKCTGVDVNQYVANQNTHINLNDIPVGARIITSPALTGKTVTDGVADCNDITFAAATGSAVGAIVFYKDSGDPATSRLIAYWDEGTNLPVQPNGGDIVIAVDSGANKLFKL